MTMASEAALNAEELRQFATPNDLRILDSLVETRSLNATAIALGVARGSVQVNVRNLLKRAAARGWSPDHDMKRPVPEPFVVRGVSTYYDAEGKVRGQWVKSRLDDARLQQVITEAAAAMAETLPRLLPMPPPAGRVAQLCNLYTLTDCHMGMLAWHREGGADWDITIAEGVLRAAFERMISAAPPAHSCVIAQLGDFLHWDGLLPVTPTSGHVLDGDTRYAKVVAAAVRVLRNIVDLALQCHQEVTVLMAEGNHDPAASVWLRAMFQAIYERERRLKVIDSPLPYYVHQHGTTMLAFHHGHLKKLDGLPLLMAAQFPEIWGATTKRYVHTGHLHHAEEREFPGIKVVRHPTLAARDAYAARGGWISERQASAITYHADYGLVATSIVTPEMLA